MISKSLFFVSRMKFEARTEDAGGAAAVLGAATAVVEAAVDEATLVTAAEAAETDADKRVAAVADEEAVGDAGLAVSTTF